MKVLLVGPACQGKTEYGVTRYGMTGRGRPWEETAARGCVFGLQQWVESLMRRDIPPLEHVMDLLSTCGDWVVVCDEVGCGVVPVDAFQRRWRDEVGALCQRLAAEADVVERIFCGIPARIKG